VAVLAYLNNAAEGWPRAPGVIEALAEAMAAAPESVGRSWQQDGDIVEQARRAVAEWLGVSDPHRIVFTGSATLALNLAIRGLPRERLRHIVTTVTEHNSVLRPVFAVSRQSGARVSIVGLNEAGGLDEASYRRASEQAPTLVALNHVSNVTGQINPVERWLEMARRAGAWTLLDASQSVGYLTLEPEAWQVDLMVFGGQKGLHGPPGLGILYVRPGVELTPLYSGGTGVRSDLLEQPEEMPTRLEAGTANAPALAGLVAALRWHSRNQEGFRARAAEMARRLEDGLKNIPAVRCFAPGTPRLGVISFRVERWEPAETTWVLQHSFGVASRGGLHCAPLMHQALGSFPEGTVRFSVSGFTQPDEIDRALEAVGRMAA